MTLGWWLAHMRLLRSRSGCILHHTIDNEAVYTLCLQNCMIYSAVHSIHYKYTELYTAPNILNIINTMYNIQQHHTYFMLYDDNSVANTGSACGWCGTILIQCGTNTNTNTDTNTNTVSYKYKHIHKYSVAHSICKEGWCSCSCISKPPHHDKNIYCTSTRHGGEAKCSCSCYKKRLCPPRPNAVDWNYCNIHYVIRVCTIVILINISLVVVNTYKNYTEI